MADSRIELLPPEVTLHLFSFLSHRDLLNVFSTCRTFREIDKDPAFWQKRIRDEFYVSLSGELNFKDQHELLLLRLRKEQSVFESYIFAMQRILQLHESPDDIEQASCEIHHSLERFSKTTFLDWLRRKYGLNKNNLNYFDTLLQHANRLLAEPVYSVCQEVTEAYLSSQHFLLSGLVKCNAKLMFNIFLHKQSNSVRHDILAKYGSNLLCHGLSLGHVAVCEKLLSLQVDPNQYTEFNHDMGVPLSMLPIYSLFLLLCKNNRAISKGKEISQLIQLLVKYGANMDLPGIAINLPVGEHLPSMRQKAASILEVIDRRDERRFYKNKVALQALLAQICNANAPQKLPDQPAPSSRLL